MTPLQTLLATYRQASLTEREKGTYFEELIRTYFRYEATYADLYSDVWLYADWADAQGLTARDTGIDLVAKTAGNQEFHAIQCKFYAEDHQVRKQDIDSFFTASGQKPFTHRIIVATTNHWTENAEQALIDQQPAVTKIDLHDLENSQIDWARYQPAEAPALKPKKVLRKHQTSAQASVLAGLASADRGKLIMACGTGKTFTSLKIAEEMAGPGKRVLFLVPSLSLLSQTLTEWTQESATPLHSFAVCSDDEVGKKRKKDEDRVETFAHELRYPATTNARRLAAEMAKRHDAHHMSVVFSTYHSLQVISEAQHLHQLAAFDLVICDEAHRTTGATFDNENESNFVKVHDADFLRAAKRLYMTATPRIYADMAKATAERDQVTLCSMDDPELFGEQLHVITFSEAVELGLLVDYKVIVLTIDEAHVSTRLQELLKDENNTLKVDDAARIIGCWKALAKHDIQGGIEDAGEAMRRAVAFCQVIEPQRGARIPKVSSKEIAAMFQAVVDAYNAGESEAEVPLVCEAAHVDGTMNATQKETKLNWLKADAPANTCRILSNVRCLSEGVDVPSLDAVLFLTPRSSPVEVVQSVGRVMRNAPGKNRGYVILPVVIPAGMDPAEALNDNKVYKVVWEVLQALRSHDDRFDAMINKLDLTGKDPKKMEVVAVTDKVPQKSVALTAQARRDQKSGADEYALGGDHASPVQEAKQGQLQFNVGELERALYAKVVKKCGNRNYWDEWARDIARIANTHITRITGIVSDPKNARETAAFQRFAKELRDDLNDSITDAEVIEMLAQHLITKPVFDALFSDYSFASHNPVSLAMQQVLDTLQEHRLDKEADTLEKFYASVRRRADGIENAAGKQKIVVELYDKFFRNAFPRMTERLGIVYTPVEVVDFIIHSIDELLQSEFGQSLGSKGVHIIDPFTGTGTFITRLLQSGLIKPEQLPHKYKNEIHANEIVLLAYYIAAINIEAVYHSLAGGEYTPFGGICLTDTFQLYEKDDLISRILVDNSGRRKRQKALDIRVIMGNPPYSAGQESANDNNQNIPYPDLDEKIRRTYAANSKSTSIKNLYDSYIRAIRWASDRIGNAGIVGFVSGSAWIERSFADGMRKSLAEEFTDIYIIHLRGDIRKNMLSSGAANEGGNVFGSGSMTGIAITFFVKNPKAKSHGNIYFHNIGDGLSGEKKLQCLSENKSISSFAKIAPLKLIKPDPHNDWLQQRDVSFEKFIILGDKKSKSSETIFLNYSLGLNSNRDSWVYNASKEEVDANMRRMIAAYTNALENSIERGLVSDPSKIKWSSSLEADFARGTKGNFSRSKIRTALYRPFQKSWLYFDGMFNHRTGQLPKIFPYHESENLVICVSGVGARAGFGCMITNLTPNLHTIDSGQCFPLYLYEKDEETAGEEDALFAHAAQTASGPAATATREKRQDQPVRQTGAASTATARHAPGYTRRDGISDAGLAHFCAAYPGETLTKEDLFYYIYGLLHSPEYRTRYADNLSKELPRIPAVKQAADFRAFSQSGRALAELHLHYETVAPYPVKLDTGKAPLSALTDADYRVTKMKFAKVRDAEGKSVADKTTVIYNPKITLRDIPAKPTPTSSTASPPSNGSWSARPSPPTKPAASSTTPTTTPPKPWATPVTPSNSSNASSPSASKR
jgi:predicted helicase